MPGRARLLDMNVTLIEPWTVERFLAWAARQEARYEFDGQQPVAMTGGSARHSRIIGNIYAALQMRLRGTRCFYFGPDLGVRTGGNKVRFPDALVTCTKFPETERLAPDPVVVFEVLSPDSGRRDRIEKVRDYASVASIRRYVRRVIRRWPARSSPPAGRCRVHRPISVWRTHPCLTGDRDRDTAYGNL